MTTIRLRISRDAACFGAIMGFSRLTYGLLVPAPNLKQLVERFNRTVTTYDLAVDDRRPRGDLRCSEREFGEPRGHIGSLARHDAIAALFDKEHCTKPIPLRFKDELARTRQPANRRGQHRLKVR